MTLTLCHLFRLGLNRLWYTRTDGEGRAAGGRAAVQQHEATTAL